MRSRAVREGSVGLVILLGAVLLGGIVLWVRGFSLGNRPYILNVEMANAQGLEVGGPVLYRGAKVGRVLSLNPSPNGVLAQVEIRPATLLIPRNSAIETMQSGFIGQISLSIRPQTTLPDDVLAQDLSPFDPNCDPALILCNQDQLKGSTGTNFDELIASMARLADLLGDSDVIGNANTTLKNLSTAAVSIRQLSRNANTTLNGFNQLSQDARAQLPKLGTAADSITQASGQVEQLSGRFTGTADTLSETANQVSSLIQDNRATLISTLDNLHDASQELKGAVAGLGPIINRVEKGKLLDNLETLAANGAEISATLKNFTTTVNNPVTLLGLAQTLDSARVTFQNTQKITTDLEQITGNPEFRTNLIKLINGLSKLVSSTQELDHQLRIVQQYSPPPGFEKRSAPSTPAPATQGGHRSP